MAINVEVFINTVVNSSGLSSLSNQLNRVASTASNIAGSTGFTKNDLKEMTNSADDILRTTRQMDRAWQDYFSTVKGAERATDKLTRRTQVFSGEWLSILFFGMALERFFGGFLRGAVNLYNEVTERQTAFGQATTRLAAAWSFLQFSIVQALEPFLVPAIDFLVNLADSFSNLPGPIKAVIGLVIGLIAFLGLLGFAAGTAKLGLDGIALAMGAEGAAGAAAVLSTKLGALLPIFGALAAALAIFATLWITDFAGIQSFTKTLLDTLGTDFDNFFKDVGMAVGGALKLIEGIGEGSSEKVKEGFNEMVAGAALAISDIVLIVVGGINLLGLFIAKAAAQIGATFGKILGQAILDQFINIFQFVINLINDLAARGVNIDPTGSLRAALGGAIGIANQFKQNMENFENPIVDLFDNLISDFSERMGAFRTQFRSDLLDAFGIDIVSPNAIAAGATAPSAGDISLTNNTEINVTTDNNALRDELLDEIDRRNAEAQEQLLRLIQAQTGG